jgi:hypothetical protein
MEEKKRCKKCGKEKDISEFHIDKSKKDGHKNICKECLSKKHYFVSNADRNVKQSLRYCLKYDGAFRWSDILGFTKEELKEHLEKQFKKGMNFENYGDVWSCTFHIPRRCYKFDSITSDEFKKCWSLKNLKPEFKEDCYRQKAVIDMNDVEKYNLWDILPVGNIESNFKNKNLMDYIIQNNINEITQKNN